MTQTDEHAVKPPEHIGAVVNLSLKYGNTRHEHSGGFLVERETHMTRLTVGKVAGNRRHTKAELTRCMLIMRHKLDQATRAWLQWLARWRRDLKVQTGARTGGDGAHLPRRRLSNTDLGLADTVRLFVGRYGVANQTTDLELLGALHLECRIKAHTQVAVLVLFENLVEALLENTHLEAVDQQLMTVRHITQRVHFEQTNLVETARKHIDHMAIVCASTTEVLVELHGALKVLDIVLLNVVMRANPLTQLGRHDLARALRTRATAEQHHTRTRVLERALKQADGHTQCRTCAALRSLVIRHGPWVTLQLLKNARELVLALRHRQHEARRTDLATCRRTRLRGWTAWRCRTSQVGRWARAGREAQHVLNLLGRVVLRATEHIALGTAFVAKLVHLHDCAKGH